MSRRAIQIENLGKEFIIGGVERSHESFREMLTGMVAAPLRKLKKLGGRANDEERFWALKDVNLNVEQGEVLGIIGRNGAGKSTLLKVLSRITQPTEGRVVTRGRVASLLEIGTGFHPELTGRENIFLNGAIIGMSSAEIESKFDEIVAFAEVARFLDMPVKRYSSGMYVRLAFAVAAHLEPEILLVDEVLAVGDSAFQKKCLGKLGEVVGEGRTVVFVSHNMSAISSLCPRAVVLEGGRVLCDDRADTAVQAYFGLNAGGETGWKAQNSAIQGMPVHLHEAGIHDAKGQLCASIGYLEPASIKVRFTSPARDDNFRLVVRLTNMSGVHVLASWDTDNPIGRTTQIGRRYESDCRIPGALLKPGRYSVSVSLVIRSHGNAEETESGEFGFEVTSVGFGEGLNRWGVVAPKLEWETFELD